jgi:hypothetical protein
LNKDGERERKEKSYNWSHLTDTMNSFPFFLHHHLAGKATRLFFLSGIIAEKERKES